jgi:hypothetical protein
MSLSTDAFKALPDEKKNAAYKVIADWFNDQGDLTGLKPHLIQKKKTEGDESLELGEKVVLDINMRSLASIKALGDALNRPRVAAARDQALKEGDPSISKSINFDRY